ASVRATQVDGESEAQTVRRLEQLDDIVFEAIDGDPSALAELRRLWPQTLRDLGAERVEESRAQYLRRAMTVWNESSAGAKAGSEKAADQAAAALEVLCLLAGS
ncbi:MAG: hypothetical protein WD176_08705, partial [Pirellulales bacterium]